MRTLVPHREVVNCPSYMVGMRTGSLVSRAFGHDTTPRLQLLAEYRVGGEMHVACDDGSEFLLEQSDAVSKILVAWLKITGIVHKADNKVVL